jgi:hypothetical protein
MKSDVLPSPIAVAVTQFVARRRRLTLARACGVVLATFIGWMLVVCLIDRLAPLPRGVRLVALIGAVGIGVVLVARPLAHLVRRRFDWIAAAQEMERIEPAMAGRLVTVVSQHVAPAGQRGARQLLQQLSNELSAVMGDGHAPRERVGNILRPWAVAIVLLVIAALLASAMPGLGLPRLVRRYVEPLSMLPPVTRSRLDVQPGSISIIEGKSLTITTNTQYVDDSVVTLHVTEDGRSWAAWSMVPPQTPPQTPPPPPQQQPGSSTTFTYTLPTVDRDLNYFVTGGDAASSTYTVHVLHPPAVLEFRIAYTYPAYTHLPPRNSSNDDGAIEAPIGSEAVLDVRATEPLADARMIIGGERFELTATADPAVREARLTVRRDDRYELHLTGSDGVTSAAPITAAIHAIADTPPVVRIVDPASDLMARPLDVLPVRFQVTDDYGVSDLSLHAQSRSMKWPTTMPVAPPMTASFTSAQLDLSTMAAAAGDVVSFWVEARDAIGQVSTSEVRRVVIAPGATSLDDRWRHAALIAASRLANRLDQEFVSSQFAPASETASVLRRELLRAILFSGDGGRAAESSVLLANLVDAAERCRCICQDSLEVSRESWDQHRDIVDDKLRETATVAETLAAELHTIVAGETADTVISERHALAELPAATISDEARASAARRADDMVRGLGLDPQAVDIDAQLQQRMVAARELAAAQKPVDFAAAARAWAGELPPRAWPQVLGRRLAVAAIAEALQPGGDPVWAGDLSLASRAVKQLSSASSSTRPSDNPMVACPVAIEALEREHELAVRQVDLTTDVRAAAEQARRQLGRWAGEDATSASPEELAIGANAAAARGDISAARDLDTRRLKAIGPESANAASSGQQETAETIRQILSQPPQSIANQSAAPAATAASAMGIARTSPPAARAAALERLAAVPSLAPLFSPPGSAEEGSDMALGSAGDTAAAASTTGQRVWGTARLVPPGSIIAPTRRLTLPEFQEELNVYFDALAAGAANSTAANGRVDPPNK